MRISEVCTRTGLTERAVRFYVEKGLIAPEVERRNGRGYLEFSEENVNSLEDISTLRDVGFSLDDIRAMQQEPMRIAEIVARRRNALRMEEARSADAFRALGEIGECGSASALASAIRERAKAAALPAPPREKPRDDWENTSGMGEMSTIPIQYQGKWNWGAFLWPVVWGIGNKVYQAFLCFIPIVGLIANLWIASKGWELAWKHKRWDSMEHFERVQRRWLFAGLAVWAVVISLGIIGKAQEQREYEAQVAAAQESFPALMAAIEGNEAYIELIKGREEWTGAADEGFYAEPGSHYRFMGTLSKESVQHGGYLYELDFRIELSDYSIWNIRCDRYLNMGMEPEISVKYNKQETMSNEIDHDACEELNLARAEHVARLTPLIEASPEWKAKFGDDFSYQTEPRPLSEGYSRMYEGGEPELWGWWAKVLSGGTIYKVSCDTNDAGELETPPVIVIALE